MHNIYTLYIYIYIHVYTYMCIHISIYIMYTYIQIYKYIYIYIYIYTQVLVDSGGGPSAQSCLPMAAKTDLTFEVGPQAHGTLLAEVLHRQRSYCHYYHY